jgi:hypothetical protein
MSTSDLPPDQEPTRVNPPAGGQAGQPAGAAGTPGAGRAGQPGQAQPPGGGQRRTFSAGVLAAVAIAVLVIAGLGGYLIGHSSGDSEGTKSGEEAGQQAGFQEGVEKGRLEGRAEFARGTPGYQAIFDAGKAEGVKVGTAQGERTGEAQGRAQGQRVGFQRGEQVGISTGQAEGVRQGAAAVLGGFTNWTDGAYYLVTVGASSTDGVPYTITSRSQLQPDTSYQLCQQGGGQQVCSAPATASASGASDATEDDGGAGTPDE